MAVIIDFSNAYISQFAQQSYNYIDIELYKPMVYVASDIYCKSQVIEIPVGDNEQFRRGWLLGMAMATK